MIHKLSILALSAFLPWVIGALGLSGLAFVGHCPFVFVDIQKVPTSFWFESR